jgi:hypothetical protein
MARKMSSKETLSFTVNPLEQEYIATCYPLPDRPGLDSCAAWKGKLTESAKTGEKIELLVPEISLAFPHLASLAIKGYFEKNSVQQYFEGLLQEGAHDTNLYLFAKRVAKNLKGSDDPNAQKVLASVLDHANGCSVKPVDLEKGKMWTFAEVVDASVDQKYFGVNIGQRFVLAHGISEIGPVAIRELTVDEFKIYTSWFEKLHKSPRNPFKHLA